MGSPRFKNRYVVLRHGESLANTQGIILSYHENGRKEEYTLTKHGEEQVFTSVTVAKEKGLLDVHTVIYSSPFSRCKKTAEIARNVLGVTDPIIFDDRLRERWFGDWEGTSNTNYQNVWDNDVSHPDHNEANVEGTGEVVLRVTGLVHDLEVRYSNKTILLVSHGDTLQILQTFFDDVLPHTHRSIVPLMVAEIRAMN